MPAKTLVLVDGSYYLFRAYHAMGDLANSGGEPTGAILGVINMIRKLRADYTPDYFAVVFDTKGKTFRNDLYPEYKANRPPVPEDLVAQIQPIHEILRAQGLPLLLPELVEADDVIATLAKQADAMGLQTIISSGDKDLAQLVNDRIRLVNTMSNTVLDAAGVMEKYGVPPERIIDYLALMGDAVDNVPGVPKVGPKTAAKWIKQYGSLDAVIEHAAGIPGKVGESLCASLDQLPLSRELVTLKTDVDLELGPDDLVCGAQDRETLREHYRRWEFRRLLRELEEDALDSTTTAVPAPEPAVETAPASAPKQAGEPGHYQAIFTLPELDQWLERLRGADLIAIDTETTSLDFMEAEIVGLSFAVEAGTAAYLPLAHDYPGAPPQLDRGEVLERLRPLLEGRQPEKLGHNLKYDTHILANYGIALAGIRHDSMLESYVLDSTATRHDMDSLALKYLGIETTHYEDVAGKGAKQIPFNHVPLETAAPYAAEDADITLRLHLHLAPKLAANPGCLEVYESIELPLLGVIQRMERNGVHIDARMLERHGLELNEQMRALERQAAELAGQPFNINSPRQIQEILYEKMQLPVHSRTPKGQPSTAESVLADLALEHDLPRIILEHRSLSKLKSTYTDRLPRQVNPRTGRIHASFHQAVAATGRLSSSDPNLQNIPIRTPEGRRIRQAFTAAPGHLLLAADYSQIELRIMAHLSGDEGLLRAFEQGEDIHRSTAAEVFGAAGGKVSDDQRRAAKAINFGLIYGMSAFGLARQLGIDRSAARDYVERYFTRYPGVRNYMDEVRAAAREKGYVETVFGRRLYLPEINARNAVRRQAAERTAINAPMQGTAADIIKRAMITIDRELLRDDDQVKLIMQVHDELVFEVARERLQEVRERISGIMAGAAQLKVPLTVDVGWGGNWDEAH